MVVSCARLGSSGRGLWQGSIGFKKISELTADKKAEHELINIVRIAKAKIAAVRRKIAPLAYPVARVLVARVLVAGLGVNGTRTPRPTSLSHSTSHRRGNS